MIEQLILAGLPAQENASIPDLRLMCAQTSGNPIDMAAFDDALKSLAVQGLVSLTNTTVKRKEPDFKETRLYGPLNSPLRSDAMLSQLRTLPENYIFEETAYGGVQGLGQFTRPDFTMAAIRQQKYDPAKHLDVTTFEVKNLAGANLMAVHETLAHTRFSHYSYLVCPRSNLRPEETDRIKLSCSEHAVGLILFDLLQVDGEPAINNLKVEISSIRRQPDPDKVDDFIERCFNDSQKAKLRKIAGLV